MEDSNTTIIFKFENIMKILFYSPILRLQNTKIKSKQSIKNPKQIKVGELVVNGNV